MEATVVSALAVLFSGAMGIVGWQLKRLLSKAAENNDELIKLRIILTGENGDNGIKGRVDAIEKGLVRDRARSNDRLLAWRLWAARIADVLRSDHPDFVAPSLD